MRRYFAHKAPIDQKVQFLAHDGQNGKMLQAPLGSQSTDVQHQAQPCESLKNTVKLSALSARLIFVNIFYRLFTGLLVSLTMYDQRLRG
jgi:hypothetical protein